MRSDKFTIKSQEAIQQAIQAGVDSYLVKGTSFEELIQAILEGKE